MLNLAHHAFSWAIDIGVAVKGCFYVRRGPVDLQAMQVALMSKVNLFDRDGLGPLCLSGVPDFIDEPL